MVQICGFLKFDALM